jgi:hypothetical protein
MFQLYDSHPLWAITLAISIPSGITQTFWREAKYSEANFCAPPSWLMTPLYCERFASWSNIAWAVFCGKWYWAVFAWLAKLIVAGLIDGVFIRTLVPDIHEPSQRSWDPKRNSEVLHRRFLAARASILICAVCAIAPWAFHLTK